MKIISYILILVMLPLSLAFGQNSGNNSLLDDEDPTISGAVTDDVLPAVGTVQVNKARVRKGPGSENKVVTHFDKGVELWIIDKEEDWYLVASPKDPEKPLGWVNSKLIQLSAASEPVEAEVKETPEPSITPEPMAVPLAEATPVPTPEPTSEIPNQTLMKPADQPIESKSAVVQSKPKKPIVVEEEGRRPLTRFVGNNRYPIPNTAPGREFLFQINPGFNSVTADRNGQFDSGAFRINATMGVELVRTLFFETFYSYVGYTPDQPTHEVGGGLRLQGNVVWRLKPYVEGGAFYSTLFEDDNFGVRGAGGLTFVVAKKPYNILMGPFVEFNRIFLPAPGNLDSIFVGWAFMFSDFVVD